MFYQSFKKKYARLLTRGCPQGKFANFTPHSPGKIIDNFPWGNGEKLDDLLVKIGGFRW